MDVLSELRQKIFKSPTDVLGLDLAAGSVGAVRLRSDGKNIHLVAADLLTGVTIPPADGMTVEPFTVPKPLCAHYAALAVAAPGTLVKLLSIPGRFGDADAQRLVDDLGIEREDDYRISYSIISEGGRTARETRVLAAALPQDYAESALALLPKGRPAPYSLEISGLAALNGFIQEPGDDRASSTVGVLEGGETQTMFAIFHKAQPVLVRNFDFGEETVIAKVGEKLGVDANTAKGFMTDGSFDVSAILQQSLETVFKQIVISKEFVERRENCSLSEIMLSGALSVIRGMDEAVKQFLGTEVRKWNPFSRLTVAPQALPESLSGQESRFTAAFGAAMAAMMDEA